MTNPAYRIRPLRAAMCASAILLVGSCDRAREQAWIIATFTMADGQTVEMAFNNPAMADLSLADCKKALGEATPTIEAGARAREPQRLRKAKLAAVRCVISRGDPLTPNGGTGVWEWLRANNAWLIGLGGIVATILGWRFARSVLQQRSDRGATAIAGDVSGSHVQSLSAEYGSTIQQAREISVHHHGPSAQEVESIAIRTFESNFVRLAGAAADLAHERAVAFTRTLIAQLEQSRPSSLGKASDPGFVQSIFQAQKQYATTGDTDLQATLIGLLVELATAPPRSLLEISLKEAIDRAGKINRTHLDILALVFVLHRVRWEHFYPISDVARFAAEYLEPFLASTGDHNSYSHLMSIGCLELGPAPSEFAVFFLSHWRTLFSKGIPRDRAQQVDDGSNGYWSMFEPFGGAPDVLRLRAQTNESIEQSARDLGLPAEMLRKIYQLDSQFLMKGAELANHARAIHPAIDRLHTVWHTPHAPLPRAYLTTLGLTLSYSHLSALGKAPGPLSIWLN